MDDIAAFNKNVLFIEDEIYELDWEYCLFKAPLQEIVYLATNLDKKGQIDLENETEENEETQPKKPTIITGIPPANPGDIPKLIV